MFVENVFQVLVGLFCDLFMCRDFHVAMEVANHSLSLDDLFSSFFTAFP